MNWYEFLNKSDAYAEAHPEGIAVIGLIVAVVIISIALLSLIWNDQENER